MTLKLYWQDPYMKEFDSKVVSRDKDLLVLQETAFYPTGGGVLNDTGVVVIKGASYRVCEVTRDGETILHHVAGSPRTIPGDPVHGMIDWDRRYTLMRYHTAMHLIDGIVESRYKNGSITGGQISTDKARLDFEMEDLNRELAQKIIDEANEVGAQGHKVFSRYVDRETALNTPRIARTEPGKELIRGMDKVRVIEIEGIDMQMDGGPHVANTQEIGKISLGKFENKGKHSKRIEIVLPGA